MSDVVVRKTIGNDVIYARTRDRDLPADLPPTPTMKNSGVLGLLLLVALLMLWVLPSSGAFIQVPVSTYVQLEEDGIFSCRARATTVYCVINGSDVIPPNISSTLNFTDNEFHLTVVVPGVKEYNNTLVQCCLYNRGQQEAICSENASLLIEGTAAAANSVPSVLPTGTQQTTRIYPEASPVPSATSLPTATPDPVSLPLVAVILAVVVAVVRAVAVIVAIVLITIAAVIIVSKKRNSTKKTDDLEERESLGNSEDVGLSSYRRAERRDCESLRSATDCGDGTDSELVTAAATTDPTPPGADPTPNNLIQGETRIVGAEEDSENDAFSGEVEAAKEEKGEERGVQESQPSNFPFATFAYQTCETRPVSDIQNNTTSYMKEEHSRTCASGGDGDGDVSSPPTIERIQRKQPTTSTIRGEGGIEVEDGEADCYYKPHSGLAESQPSPEIDHLM